MIHLTLQPLYPRRKDSRFPVKKSWVNFTFSIPFIRITQLQQKHTVRYNYNNVSKRQFLHVSGQRPKLVGVEVLKHCCDSSEMCAFVGLRCNKVWVNLTTCFYTEAKQEIWVVAEVDPRFFRSQQREPSTVMTITANGKKVDLKSLCSAEQFIASPTRWEEEIVEFRRFTYPFNLHWNRPLDTPSQCWEDLLYTIILLSRSGHKLLTA